LPFLAARPALFGSGCFGTGGAEKEKVDAVSGFPAGLFFPLPVFFFVMLTERKNTGGPGHPFRPKKQNDIFWCPAAERRVEVCRIQRLNFRIPLIMINFVAFIRNA